MLQVAGVQEAVIAADPGFGVVTFTMLPVFVPQLLLPIAATVEFEEQNVSGTPVIVTFWLSMTVGTMSLLVSCVTVKEVDVVPLTAKPMDFTRQVVKGNGTLFAPPML